MDESQIEQLQIALDMFPDQVCWWDDQDGGWRVIISIVLRGNTREDTDVEPSIICKNMLRWANLSNCDPRDFCITQEIFEEKD